MRKHAGIIALLFPLVVLAFMAGGTVLQRQADTQVWRIKIGGYDPRDLLYGHYLSFRYQWNLAAAEGGGSIKAHECLCLTASGSGIRDPLVRPMSCGGDEAKTCPSLIRAYPSASSWTLTRGAPADRYFIPEENAHKIESLLREGKQDFYMEISPRSDRSVAVRGLYIGDMSLEDYLRSLK